MIKFSKEKTMIFLQWFIVLCIICIIGFIGQWLSWDIIPTIKDKIKEKKLKKLQKTLDKKKKV
mgnify:CR=1 FL=1